MPTPGYFNQLGTFDRERTQLIAARSEGARWQKRAERRSLLRHQRALLTAFKRHGEGILRKEAYRPVLASVLAYEGAVSEWVQFWEVDERDFWRARLGRASELAAKTMSRNKALRLVDPSTCEISVDLEKLDAKGKEEAVEVLSNFYTTHASLAACESYQPPVLSIYWGNSNGGPTGKRKRIRVSVLQEESRWKLVTIGQLAYLANEDLRVALEDALSTR